MTNKRQHARLDYDLAVELTIDGERRPGRTVNISRGGILVSIDETPEFGAKATLHIDLPGVPKTCDIPCIVRWSKPDGGAGLQFEQLRPIEVWALNKLLSSLD